MKSPTLIQKISYFSVLLVLVVIFSASAYLKFSNDETILNNFSKWNLMKWKNIISCFEIAGLVLLLIPRTNVFGCLALTGVLLGGVVTHIQHSEPFYFPAAITLVIWINFIFIKPKKVQS